MFANAAITATGQREFHSGESHQRLSLDFLHDYVLGNYRDLYTATLALDINDHNAALIIRRLLDSAGEANVAQRRTEGRLIARRLGSLPPQRVYRLFGDLRKAGVNNRRTRAIIRDWLASRTDPTLDAVKYRNALELTLRHTHLAPPHEEVGEFLFAPHGGTRFTAPLLNAWREAHYAKNKLYDLPFTVAEGFAARRGIDRGEFLERIAPRMTRLEQLRLQESARRHDAGAVHTELRRMPLTRLASYVLSLPLDDRVRRRAELDEALATAARRAAGTESGRWGRVAAVLDDSFSSSGSTAKRRRPLAVALASHYLLRTLAAEYIALWTSGRTDAVLGYPYGATPLGHRIIDALDSAPDRLVIVSDGWDNAPPGLAAEVLRVWRTCLDTDSRVDIVHLNPVYDAGDFEVRRLSATVPTVGIRDAEDLPALVELAHFAAGHTGLSELTAYLDARIRQFLEAR
ncbi:hypothetical protein GCM10011588_57220 [Nocardia jinanensis]|uniref:TROVE domain-containing protein n=1 Tax=Nocardia jinanensis TaxID=382504 RepID=A0A917RUV8_9NOCA|nr:hypothetical protein GCM10011588_57220 [Nocardia jinanensis]